VFVDVVVDKTAAMLAKGVWTFSVSLFCITFPLSKHRTSNNRRNRCSANTHTLTLTLTHTHPPPLRTHVHVHYVSSSGVQTVKRAVVRTHARTHTCTHLHADTPAHAHTHAHTHMHTHTHTRVHTRICPHYSHRPIVSIKNRLGNMSSSELTASTISLSH
jgi:hypothetical protein